VRARFVAWRALAFTAGVAASAVGATLLPGCDCFEDREVLPVAEGTYELVTPVPTLSGYAVTYSAAAKEVRVTFVQNGVPDEYAFAVVRTSP
jgi:hypothetical protein